MRKQYNEHLEKIIKGAKVGRTWNYQLILENGIILNLVGKGTQCFQIPVLDDPKCLQDAVAFSVI